MFYLDLSNKVALDPDQTKAPKYHSNKKPITKANKKNNIIKNPLTPKHE
jgi:hypothetical protein